MRHIIIGIAVKELVAQWNMAIGDDIQTEYDLLAVRPPDRSVGYPTLPLQTRT